jgi:transposase
MDNAWTGVDAGKEFHWAHVLDASGSELLSRKIENDEADIPRLIDEVISLAQEVVWAVDQPGGGAALLLALLWERDQRVLYIPGLTVKRARDFYRGESKTDARDAHVIADQARMRPDVSELRPGEEEIAELQLLLGRRRDLITDQSRTITRIVRKICPYKFRIMVNRVAGCVKPVRVRSDTACMRVAIFENVGRR